MAITLPIGCGLLALLGALLLPAATTAPAPTAAPGGFAAYDVFVDAGTHHLGAFQFAWQVPLGMASIVGVEGGDGVFQPAPYYDPAALQQHRIVVAGFSLADALPTGRTRVARLHLHLTGDGEPQCTAELRACADGAGTDLPANLTWQKVENK